jgi:hypothetical protein
MSINPSKGIEAGIRLQEFLTADLRVEHGKKGWETRRKNLEERGETFSSVMSQKQADANIANGKRLQERLTQKERIVNAKKGWEKRYKRYQYWGA